MTRTVMIPVIKVGWTNRHLMTCLKTDRFSNRERQEPADHTVSNRSFLKKNVVRGSHCLLHNALDLHIHSQIYIVSSLGSESIEVEVWKSPGHSHTQSIVLNASCRPGVVGKWDHHSPCPEGQDLLSKLGWKSAVFT